MRTTFVVNCLEHFLNGQIHKCSKQGQSNKSLKLQLSCAPGTGHVTVALSVTSNLP